MNTEELYSLIGKLYVDIVNMKQIIDSLKNIKTKHYSNYKSSIKTNYISDLIINSAILIPLYSHIENYIILNKLHHSTNIKFFNN